MNANKCYSGITIQMVTPPMVWVEPYELTEVGPADHDTVDKHPNVRIAKSSVKRTSKASTVESVKQPRAICKVYLTAQDVADMLACSVKTIYSWAETGYASIPAIKIGKGQKSLLRFDPDHIAKWISEQKDQHQSQFSFSSRYTDKAGTVAVGLKKGG